MSHSLVHEYAGLGHHHGFISHSAGSALHNHYTVCVCSLIVVISKVMVALLTVLRKSHLSGFRIWFPGYVNETEFAFVCVRMSEVADFSLCVSSHSYCNAPLMDEDINRKKQPVLQIIPSELRERHVKLFQTDAHEVLWDC